MPDVIERTREYMDLHERERALDWLTALSPIFLIAVCYYRWQAAGLVITASAAYVAVTVLLQWAGIGTWHTVSAMVFGSLAAFCLPATAPLWVAALAGGVAALVAVLPQWLHRTRPAWPVSHPLLHPALVGYLFVRLVFPRYTTDFRMPYQWAGLDSASGATPLTMLTNSDAVENPLRLLTGLYPAAIGEGCVPVILLAALFLLLRRRLRLIAPTVMLATVSVTSWILWQMPLYSLLMGGVMLGALLLADRAFAPVSYGEQAFCGFVAGAIVVLMRCFLTMDGTAVAVLVACGLSPLYGPALHWSDKGVRWLWKYIKIFSVWFWHAAAVPFARLVARGTMWCWHRGIVPFARFLWRQMGRLANFLRKKCVKLLKTRK